MLTGKSIFQKWKEKSSPRVTLYLLPMTTILFSFIIHWLGTFDTLELKLYDHLLKEVRGPLTGWNTRDSSYNKKGTDVVLVEVDDEAWRLIPETWPYSRGFIWSRALENLATAGAKVVLFDIQFDTPERQSEYLREFIAKNPQEKRKNMLPVHGDSLFAQTIRKVQSQGCTVILSTKMAKEPELTPSQYIVKPVSAILEATPEMGVVDDYFDSDGVLRRYSLGSFMDHEPNRIYLSLGLKAIKAFHNLPDTLIPIYNSSANLWQYGPYAIPTIPNSHTFFINYYGPTSNYKLHTLPKWETFPSYPLSLIIDTKEIMLRDSIEDVDWMDQFISSEIPAWIEAVEDKSQREAIISKMGLDQKSDRKKSPFYNKIVIVGVAVEAIHDVKQTPFYHYTGTNQYMPGLEIHAHAIQTILDHNYIRAIGGNTTNINHGNTPLSHLGVTLLLTAITMAITYKQHPILSLVLLLGIGIVYYHIACGLFIGDIFYGIKKVFLLVPKPLFLNRDLLTISLPKPGESLLIPIVYPLFTIFLTYIANLIYALLSEHQKKVLLRESFGAYVSPKLIETMYETNHKPELGGVEDNQTAFFTDIANFSSISELITPTELVFLMNEYFSAMTDILLANDGTLDKYIGDAIVAFWGSPLPVSDQEKRACKTALEMNRALKELQKTWKEKESHYLIYTMQHRIGIHSGSIVTGNIGSTTRMNYTMMGDSVNIGARLESSAKQYGITIHISETVFQKVEHYFECRFIDFVRVKGKDKPLKTYELLGYKGKLSEKEYNCIALFNKGIMAYQEKEWEKALSYFLRSGELEKDPNSINPSRIYIKRCQHFLKNPPPPTWDGVWTLTEK